MWNAFRSDFKEFASAIASDSTTVLENIDSKLKEHDNDIDNNNCDYDFEHSDREQQHISHSKNQQYNALLAIDPELAHTADADDNEEEKQYQQQQHDKSRNQRDMDNILIEALGEAYRRMEMEVTFITPLLSEVNGVNRTEENDITAQINNNALVVPAHTEEEKRTEVTTVAKENDGVNNRDTGADADAQVEVKEETTQDEIAVEEETDDNDIHEENNDEDDDNSVANDYQVDVDQDEQDIKLFLETFDVQSKTEEIGKLLAEQPFLSQHFDNLVPISVSYEQFWQRYFYRCDPHRIVKEWQEEEELARLHRQELIDKGVKSVQNIFGGALKAIKNVTYSNGARRRGGGSSSSSIYEKYQAELEEQQRAMLKDNNGADNVKGRRGILGMFGGRPPFVMNTAESDEDDEFFKNDVGEDEEEEEELGWGSDDEEDDDEEDDESKNDTQEIVFENNRDASSEGSIAEINNLKAMLEETQVSKHEAESKAQKLQEVLNSLREEMKIERNSFEAWKDSQSKNLNDNQTQNKLHEAAINNLTTELNEAHQFAKTLEDEIAQVHSGYETEFMALKETIENLTTKLQESELTREELNVTISKLKVDLETCRDEMTKQKMNFAKIMEDEIAIVRAEQKDAVGSSPALAQEGSSISSAVDVSPYCEPDIRAQKDEEEDGWGDSWSDDDDEN